MTDDEKWEWIETSLNSMRKQMDRLDAAAKGLLIPPESPLIEPTSIALDVTIRALELLVGDESGGLSYWVFECDFGGNPMEVTVSDETRKMHTLADIRWAVEGVA